MRGKTAARRAAWVGFRTRQNGMRPDTPHPMRFANQVAIVTGAGRGIGRAIATRLSAEGARVAVVSRTEQNAIQVAEDINAKFAGLAKAYAVDVADHAAVQKVCAQITADFTRV